MPSPKEEHKLTVLWNGQRYAVISHSVEKDETLQVYIRRGLAEVVSHGRPEFSNDGSMIIHDTPEISLVGDQIHYHPTGRVVRKDGNKGIRTDKFYPLIKLLRPIMVLAFSPPRIEDLKSKNDKKHEFLFDLNQIAKFNRLDFQVWISPKGYKNFAPPNTYAPIKFEHILYDVIYFIKEMETVDAKIENTFITKCLETSNVSDSDNETPEIWVGALAINKQIRTFMNIFHDLNAGNRSSLPNDVPELFYNDYGLRMSSCRDGIIGAIGARGNSNLGNAFMEYRHFPLTVEDVKKMLICDHNGDLLFIDIADIISEIPKDKFFVRVKDRLNNKMKHDIVIIGSKRTSGAAYYQLPNEITNLVLKIRNAWVKLIMNSTIDT